ncbi:low affinity iron permease family protein [Subtercola frigoramans]|uniref:Low affinity Fe/Cu permease n=2 Tax=Subtercola frigoramans TaxID=120298 RepID=A0ABS2L0N2_9MICO|nr:low affinity iron permease family protein [Subtercola frigoramans]MBM7470599.1 low affinity Fe/Cu permease [Subtercola frigoramans]
MNPTSTLGRWRRGLFGSITNTVTSSAPGGATRSRGSRLLHTIGQASSHSAAGLIATAAILAWIAFGIFTRFPDWWDNVLYIVSSSVTLIMVFAIQHTQSRQQSATQRKLDEILRAMPGADDRLIAVEEAPDAELEALAELNLNDREKAIDDNGLLSNSPPDLASGVGGGEPPGTRRTILPAPAPAPISKIISVSTEQPDQASGGETTSTITCPFS